MGSMSMTQFLFSFEGRITRSAYWLKFTLPYIVIFGALTALGMMLAGPTDAYGMPMGPPSTAATIVNAITGLFGLVALWPSLAVAAKRWHDRGKSGWWTLIVLVPIVGSIWMLVECGFLRGTDGANRFGADPLGGGMAHQPAMEPQV